MLSHASIVLSLARVTFPFLRGGSEEMHKPFVIISQRGGVFVVDARRMESSHTGAVYHLDAVESRTFEKKNTRGRDLRP
jgi:hypothetical protein